MVYCITSLHVWGTVCFVGIAHGHTMANTGGNNHRTKGLVFLQRIHNLHVCNDKKGGVGTGIKRAVSSEKNKEEGGRGVGKKNQGHGKRLRWGQGAGSRLKRGVRGREAGLRGGKSRGDEGPTQATVRPPMYSLFALGN